MCSEEARSSCSLSCSLPHLQLETVKLMSHVSNGKTCELRAHILQGWRTPPQINHATFDRVDLQKTIKSIWRLTFLLRWKVFSCFKCKCLNSYRRMNHIQLLHGRVWNRCEPFWTNFENDFSCDVKYWATLSNVSAPKVCVDVGKMVWVRIILYWTSLISSSG